jgi:uncharacterized protein YjbI with pentapeptide repeats
VSFDILNRRTRVIAYHSEKKTRREAILEAVAANANLSYADLSGTNLSGANLRYADLSGTDLRYTDLSGTDLRYADLSGADLRYADLSGTDLSGANLRGANLRYADLSGVPVIPEIHKRVYGAVSLPGALEMGAWHTCETTHCRGGWVVTLAGEDGKALEIKIGTSAAAALIYIKSDPTLARVPSFHASNADALADMKRLAEAS